MLPPLCRSAGTCRRRPTGSYHPNSSSWSAEMVLFQRSRKSMRIALYGWFRSMPSAFNPPPLMSPSLSTETSTIFRNILAASFGMKIEGFHLESVLLSDKLVKRLSGFQSRSIRRGTGFSRAGHLLGTRSCIRLKAVRRLDAPRLSDVEHVVEPELRLHGFRPVAEDAAGTVVPAHQVERPVLLVAVEDEPCAFRLWEKLRAASRSFRRP